MALYIKKRYFKKPKILQHCKLHQKLEKKNHPKPKKLKSFKQKVRVTTSHLVKQILPLHELGNVWNVFGNLQNVLRNLQTFFGISSGIYIFQDKKLAIKTTTGF